MKKLLSTLVIALPLMAFTFDYSPAHYGDVRAGSKEYAAINLLTHAGVVKGYDGGWFGPTRQVNRAEFLKIALMSAGDFATDFDPSVDARDCFPDVHAGDWFSPYVCYAQDYGIVSGYPLLGVEENKWMFHPERPVSYGEALKMLTQIYGYEIHAQSSSDHWAEAYYAAAAAKNVDLARTITLDTPLTRAQVARMAAAFAAEHAGRLSEYLQAEGGTMPSSVSSTSSSSSVSSSQSSSSSSSSSSVSSSSSSSSSSSIGAISSHFLLTGQVSQPIADGLLKGVGEPVHVRFVQVTLFQEVSSINTIQVFTEAGQLIATLPRRNISTPPDYKQYYELSLPPGTDFALPSGDIRLIIKADVRSGANNGTSTQLLQVRTFNVTLHGDTTGETFNQAPASSVSAYPVHQTSYGRMTSVQSNGNATGTLQSGTGKLISSYTFSGAAVEGKTLTLQSLIFSVTQTGDVQASNWRLTSPDGLRSTGCSQGSDGISCLSIPADVGVLQDKGVTLLLTANITAGNGAATLQANLQNPGNPTTIGSVHWSDTSGPFRWVEQGVIRGTATLWQK